MFVAKGFPLGIQCLVVHVLMQEDVPHLEIDALHQLFIALRSRCVQSLLVIVQSPEGIAKTGIYPPGKVIHFGQHPALVLLLVVVHDAFYQAIGRMAETNLVFIFNGKEVVIHPHGFGLPLDLRLVVLQHIVYSRFVAFDSFVDCFQFGWDFRFFLTGREKQHQAKQRQDDSS